MAAVPMHAPNDAELAQLREECTRLFPLPGRIERVWLYRSLAEIADRVSWLQPWLGHYELAGGLRALEAKTLAEVPEAERRARVYPLRGGFGLAGAVIGNGTPGLPRGLLALRGLLWIAVRHASERQQPFASAAEDVASALRAMVRSPAARASLELAEPLQRLSRAESLTDAVEALDSLSTSTHNRLNSAWRSWLKPTLEEIATGTPRPPRPRTLSQPKPAPEPTTPKPPGKSRKGARNERPDESITIVPLRRRKRHPDQLPSEPAEEFSQPVVLAEVPGFGTGTYTRQQAQFRAGQAIWGGNPLLLTEHVDCLPPDLFGQVLQALIQRLEAEPLDETMVAGSALCLLKAVTGRTTGRLKRLELGAPKRGDRPRDWCLDFDEGLLRFPPYWKQAAADEVKSASADASGHFLPTPEQRDWLAPVSDHISLPLPRQLHRALLRHRAVIEQALKQPESALDEWMSDASRSIGAELDLALSAGVLRRSLAPLIAERSGDLAMAQLVTGDSLGPPSSQQNYYAPRRKDVAQVYTEVIGELIGITASPRIAEGSTRVGSELLVTAEAAKRLSVLSASHRSEGPVMDAALDSMVARHQRILDHLVRMILISTGHRPAEALFDLTLADLDLATGAALFRDKRHDIAHDPRLACLPSVVVKQIRAYLQHIGTLSCELPQLAETVNAVATARAALLFDLDPRGRPVRPTLRDISERAAPEWRVLPLNWGRTYIRTRGVEMGAPAFLMACQLGHFDAVGYPYSNVSPTDPVEVLDATRPWLDRVAATQGWTIVEGVGADKAPGDERAGTAMQAQYPIMPPLQDWRAAIEESDSTARKAHRQWERNTVRNARRMREKSLERVLKHSVLVDAGVSAAFRQEGRVHTIRPLAELDLAQIRSELLLECGDDAGAAVASIRALRNVLRVVANRTGQDTPALPLPLPVRRPLDNAFFSGACLALTQVQALRRHIAERSKEKRPDRGWALQLARTAESLAVFGGIDDVTTLLDVLAGRNQAQPSARIPDLLLVPITEGRVIAVRGIASLALANLVQAFPEDPLPDPVEIDRALAQLLPDWALPEGRTPSALLERLASTVAVSNRFELSPAARHALDAAHGCTHAELAEQLAFIDQDPVSPPRPQGQQAGDDRDAEASTPLPRSISRAKGSASSREQYNMLCRVIPQPRRDLDLPVTGKHIPATNIQTESTRAAVIAEVDALIEQSDSGQGPRLWPIIRLLADWLRAELSRRKPNGAYLADRAVSTYLTRIGGALQEELGTPDAARWTEQDFELAYDYALFRSDDAKDKVAAALLSFHQHCAARFPLPEVDLGPVYAALRSGGRNVDSAMVLPAEREALLAELEQRAWHEDAHDFEAVRLSRLADFIALMLGHAGCRLGEPLGLQVRDVALRPSGGLRVRIRPNRLRRLKTLAARRIVRFGPRCDQRHHERAVRWYDSVRRHAGARRPDGAFLMAELESTRAFGEHQALATTIREALARATGRQSERLHRLRHLLATELVCHVVLSRQDAVWSGLPVADDLLDRPLQPRDLHAIALPLGHSHWRTTLQSYFHIPWLLQSRADARLRDAHFGRQAVAGALGYTPFALDNLLRGREGVDALQCWFDHVRPRRKLPEPKTPAAKEEPKPTAWTWTAQRMGQLVDHAWRSKDLHSALVVIGVPLSEAERVVEVAERWELKLGLRLIPEFVGTLHRDCPSRAVRRMTEDQLIERLWQRFDEGTPEQQEALARIGAEFFSYLLPGADHRILLPADEAGLMVDLLKDVGVNEEQIELQAAAGGLVFLAVRRSEEARQATRYRGLGIKRVLAVVGSAVALLRSDP